MTFDLHGSSPHACTTTHVIRSQFSSSCAQSLLKTTPSLKYYRNFPTRLPIFLDCSSIPIFPKKCQAICARAYTSIIGLRRSTHPSPKVDTSISEGRHIVTSIFEGRHIDLRRATHRSSKVDTSIIDLRKSTHRSSKIEGGNITPTIRRRILSTTALLSPWSRRSYTRSYIRTCTRSTYTHHASRQIYTGKTA